MLKNLSKDEIETFTKNYELKCDSLVIEKSKNQYFLIIDEVIRFSVNKKIVEDIYSLMVIRHE